MKTLFQIIAAMILVYGPLTTPGGDGFLLHDPLIGPGGGWFRASKKRGSQFYANSYICVGR